MQKLSLAIRGLLAMLVAVILGACAVPGETVQTITLTMQPSTRSIGADPVLKDCALIGSNINGGQEVLDFYNPDTGEKDSTYNPANRVFCARDLLGASGVRLVVRTSSAPSERTRVQVAFVFMA